MTLVSTPEERFEDIEGYDYEPEYVSVGEPEMAYVDVEGDGDETFLCLHGEPTWGFLYRKMIPRLRDRGRVVVPDFVGFGRSDKYTEIDEYSFGAHYDTLARFVEELGLTDVTLVCQDWGSILGLPLAVSDEPERFSRIVAMNALLTDGEIELSDTWYSFKNMVVNTDKFDIPQLIDGACVDGRARRGQERATDAPFESEDEKAGAYAWPPMVPQNPEMEGADVHAQLMDDLAEYEKPFFALFSDSDPVTQKYRDILRDVVPTASDEPDVWVEGAGHFIQEDTGEECAEHIVDFVDRS
ncbi:MAG: haloalkane dehalogenase [Halobacteriales archaeon]|nr:haloalkane dehalogenase [Halobacteriales archaeon]